MRRKPSPKKSLGQHFLSDRNIMSKMEALADLQPGSALIEIGPGPGDLTAFLLERGYRVAAVEIDERMESALTERLGNHPAFTLVGADALSVDYPELIRTLGFTPPVPVMGNFPYNVGTHLIRTLLPLRGTIDRICCLLQEEVVRRMTAAPGSPDYGYLSVYCRYFSEPVAGFRVRPGSFHPRPRVQSMTTRLDLRPTPLLPPDQEPRFLALLSAAFRFRRKSLANNLVETGPGREILVEFLSERSLSPVARAEELGLDDFLALFRILDQ